MLLHSLKPLFGRPGPPGLKCTSAAAPTLQQTVACGFWSFNAQNTTAKTLILTKTHTISWNTHFMVIAYILLLSVAVYS